MVRFRQYHWLHLKWMWTMCQSFHQSVSKFPMFHNLLMVRWHLRSQRGCVIAILSWEITDFLTRKVNFYTPQEVFKETIKSRKDVTAKLSFLLDFWHFIGFVLIELFQAVHKIFSMEIANLWMNTNGLNFSLESWNNFTITGILPSFSRSSKFHLLLVMKVD